MNVRNIETERTPFDFQIESVVVTADRLDFGQREFDISNVISEINIFEMVDKPFLTGTILFLDNANLFNDINWLGTEKISMTIRTDERSTNVIEKKFRVVKIIQAVKSNDQNESFLIEIVEDHAYESNLIRVQQSYEGHHDEIIEKILKEHLGRELMYVPSTGFKRIRAIVPNLTPLDAANWIKEGKPDAYGSPYFLYSSIADDKIRLIDLESVLGLLPLNTDTPYIYSQSYGPQGPDLSVIDQSYIIQTYRSLHMEDLSKLIKSGYVSGRWNFFDTTKGEQFQVDHDIKKTFDNMVSRRVFNKNQNDPIFDEDAGVHTYSSREISQIATSRTYTDWSDYNNYYEGGDLPLHEQKVIQKSLRNFLLKSPIDVSIPGSNFLQNNTNKTIGNIINLRFQVNDNLYQRYETDHKRSGDYFIYAARHVFSGNRYTVNLKCAKLAQSVGVER
jgi:hypothetical protein|tara:strand:+ start:10594 stop:11934 length:1341 start_codon:yes stop_codon:yes gene_type:complete